MGVAVTRVHYVEAEDQSANSVSESVHRAWAGRGTGARCDLCHEPIAADQLEYEIELRPATCARAMILHLGCYERWVQLSVARRTSRIISQNG